MISFNFCITVSKIVVSGSLVFSSKCLTASDQKLKQSYDFVIVGAGSTGSVIANRLSEIDDVTVLILEAGGEEDPIINEIPELTTEATRSYQNWKYETAFQNSSFFGKIKKKFPYIRGKVLGGTSSLNGMIYLIGNHRDYDLWNKEAGGGWSWKEVFPYFLKSEDIHSRNAETRYHGTGGYLTVTEMEDTTLDVIFEAGQEIGLEKRDVNGEIQTGMMYFQSTIRDGARCSTNKAFLKPAADRKNLKIVTHAHVTKVLLSSSNDGVVRARGVCVDICGQSVDIEANLEVILSAGAFGSPQLLMKRFIRTFVYLPGVGRNLQDHNTPLGMYFVSDEDKPEQKCNSNFLNNLLQWSFNKTGPLVISGITAFIKSTKADQKDDWPDIQLFIQSTASSLFMTETKRGFGCMPIVLNPLSRGIVQLQSSNASVQPLIDPRYLSHPEDADKLLEAWNVCLSLASTEAIKALGLKVKPHGLKKCDHLKRSYKEQLKCSLRDNFAPGLHACGTCKMGKESDGLAVVDSRLRVFNVSGLRVADASIMPFIPRGNTNAPAIMIGERVSDFIKLDNQFI